MISHFEAFSRRPVTGSESMMVLTSLAKVGRSEERDKSSMKPISRSESNSVIIIIIIIIIFIITIIIILSLLLLLILLLLLLILLQSLLFFFSAREHKACRLKIVI